MSEEKQLIANQLAKSLMVSTNKHSKIIEKIIDLNRYREIIHHQPERHHYEAQIYGNTGRGLRTH